MLNIVCVKWGDAYSPKYVNNLYNMIRLNTTKQFNFYCFTENPKDLYQEIKIIDLPSDLTGWWGKLYMFKKGLFNEGERIVFFDLDTIIVDNIDDILSYDGEFAILRDFYRSNGYGSGVMAWKVGFGHHIWENWNILNRPMLPGGDQEFIEQQVKVADLWQDLYPSKIQSFKQNNNENFPDIKANVICFHGQPKPHNCGKDWVDDIWNCKKANASVIKESLNVEKETLLNNVKENSTKYPVWVNIKPEHRKTAVIIGGAPSINQNVQKIKEYKENGADIFCVNNSLNWCIERNIKPEGYIMMDAKPINEKFVERRYNTTYYLASMVDKSVFNRLNGLDIKVWHAYQNIGEQEIFKDCDRPVLLVCGGTTVMMRAPHLLYALGYRKFVFFGVDSSFEEGKHHAYDQKHNDKDKVIDVELNGKKYQSTYWMTKQVLDFYDANDLGSVYTHFVLRHNCEISVYGNGLLPDYYQSLMAKFHLIETQAKFAYDFLMNDKKLKQSVENELLFINNKFFNIDNLIGKASNTDVINYLIIKKVCKLFGKNTLYIPAIYNIMKTIQEQYRGVITNGR